VERDICPIAESIMTDTVCHLVFTSQLLTYLKQTRLLLPVWNPTSLSFASTPFSYVTWEFRRFANI